MQETHPLNVALRRKLILFLVLGACCVFVLAAYLLLRKEAGSLRMSKGKTDSSKAMLSTVNEMESSLKRLRELLPLQLTVRIGEERIYALLDALRIRYRSAEIKVETLQERGDELVMPVRINLRGLTYDALTREVGYLQSLRFPFFEITEIALGPGQSAGLVSGDINGALRIFKPSAPKQ
jgi:hypothetical protein